MWAHICRAGSFIFFCIQAYFLLNMAYGLNDKLLEVAASHGSSCEQTAAKTLLLVFSIASSMACFVWMGFQYKWYFGCGLGLFILILTTAFVVFFYVVALIKLCNV